MDIRRISQILSHIKCGTGDASLWFHCEAQNLCFHSLMLSQSLSTLRANRDNIIVLCYKTSFL